MFQGNRLGLFGYRFLAQRVLHSYFGLEPVFSVSIFQVSELKNRNKIFSIFYKSFSHVLPWTKCGQAWNSKCCTEQFINGTGIRPEDCPTGQNVTYPEQEYWRYVFLYLNFFDNDFFYKNR